LTSAKSKTGNEKCKNKTAMQAIKTKKLATFSENKISKNYFLCNKINCLKKME